MAISEYYGVNQIVIPKPENPETTLDLPVYATLREIHGGEFTGIGTSYSPFFSNAINITNMNLLRCEGQYIDGYDKGIVRIFKGTRYVIEGSTKVFFLKSEKRIRYEVEQAGYTVYDNAKILPSYRKITLEPFTNDNGSVLQYTFVAPETGYLWFEDFEEEIWNMTCNTGVAIVTPTYTAGDVLKYENWYNIDSNSYSFPLPSSIPNPDSDNSWDRINLDDENLYWYNPHNEHYINLIGGSGFIKYGDVYDSIDLFNMIYHKRFKTVKKEFKVLSTDPETGVNTYAETATLPDGDDAVDGEIIFEDDYYAVYQLTKGIDYDISKAFGNGGGMDEGYFDQFPNIFRLPYKTNIVTFETGTYHSDRDYQYNYTVDDSNNIVYTPSDYLKNKEKEYIEERSFPSFIRIFVGNDFGYFGNVNRLKDGDGNVFKSSKLPELEKKINTVDNKKVDLTTFNNTIYYGNYNMTDYSWQYLDENQPFFKYNKYNHIFYSFSLFPNMNEHLPYSKFSKNGENNPYYTGFYSHIQNAINRIDLGIFNHNIHANKDWDSKDIYYLETYSENNILHTNDMVIYSEGMLNLVSGQSSHVEGAGNIAISKGVAPYNTYFDMYGFTTEDFIDSSVFNEFNGGSAHAEGFLTASFGFGCHSEGFAELPYSYKGYFENYYSNYNDRNIHGYFRPIVALNKGSHVEGFIPKELFASKLSLIAFGNGSHVEGTVIDSGYSNPVNSILQELANNNAGLNDTDFEKFVNYNTNMFYFGGNYAFGTATHVEGAGNIALGDYSHVSGNCNIAWHPNSFVIGQWNDPVKDSYFTVGNGFINKDVGVVYRHNIFEICKDDSILIRGHEVVDSTNDTTRKFVLVPECTDTEQGNYNLVCTCMNDGTKQYGWVKVSN